MSRLLAFIISWHSVAGFAQTWNSRRCGKINVIASDSPRENSSLVCRLDSGLFDDEYLTEEGRTNIYVQPQLAELYNKTTKLIDHVLLQEVLKEVEKRLKALDPIFALPNKKDYQEIKNATREFKEMLLNSDDKPGKQLKTLFKLYPDILDKIYKDQPDYKALLCRYKVKEKRRQWWKKFFKVSSVIVGWAAVVLAPATFGVGLVGLIPASSIGPILTAMGITNAALAGGDLAINLSDWSDYKAGSVAKDLLKIDKALKRKIKDLLSNPEENKKEILTLQIIRLAPNSREALKNTKKFRGKKIKEIIASSLRLFLGVALIKGGSELDKTFGDFDEPGEVEIINSINSSNSSGASGNGNFGSDDGG